MFQVRKLRLGEAERRAQIMQLVEGFASALCPVPGAKLTHLSSKLGRSEFMHANPARPRLYLQLYS